jgi:dTDP-4-amino-4,6-dideoxygalactose transaminase
VNPRIPFRDLEAQDASLRSEIRTAVDGVLASGTYVGGPQVSALERDLAEALGVQHVVAVNSGTDALVLALRAAGVGPGDEVIVPSYTFIATASAVSLVGATPVFTDVLPESFTIDPSGVAAAVTARTRAVIAVHLFGEPAALDELAALCADRGLLLVEDVAQAFGAAYRGRPVGGFGALAALSFYPTKNLACAGDGGAVATDDSGLASAVRSLANHGATGLQRYARLGINSRLDEIQAAILRVKLPHVDRWNQTRGRLATAYREGLRGVALRLPEPPAHVRHVYHQFVIGSTRRDTLRDHLAAAGIETAIYYPTPCHLQPMYAGAAAHASRRRSGEPDDACASDLSRTSARGRPPGVRAHSRAWGFLGAGARSGYCRAGRSTEWQ